MTAGRLRLMKRGYGFPSYRLLLHVILFKVYQALASATDHRGLVSNGRAYEKCTPDANMRPADPDLWHCWLDRERSLCQGFAEGDRRDSERHISFAVVQEILDQALRWHVVELNVRRPEAEAERAERG